MGIRWIGKCWGYTLMLSRIALFITAFLKLGSLFCKVMKQSFELYDEESGFYGVLAGHENWLSFILCGIIWCLVVLFLFFIVISFLSYFVFLRIYGFCKQLKHHCRIFCSSFRRYIIEFILGNSRHLVIHNTNYRTNE